MEKLNELALFAGIGGGILGGSILGWRTVCAVEIDPYARGVLCARQNDGYLSPFPIWDDIRTFDGRPWSGIIDIITGGFPCQDISIAGKGGGIESERSGLWSEMYRIIREVMPKYVYIENSPFLRTRGIEVIFQNLADCGYNAEWGIVPASAVGAPHERKRLWILAHRNVYGCTYRQNDRGDCCNGGESKTASANKKWNTLFNGIRENASILENKTGGGFISDKREMDNSKQQAPGGYFEIAGTDGWFETEPELDRVVDGVPHRVERINGIGNAQVPRVAAEAFNRLKSRINT
ncbi:hypothetical protein [Microcystis phage Mel-JY01]